MIRAEHAVENKPGPPRTPHYLHWEHLLSQREGTHQTTTTLLLYSSPLPSSTSSATQCPRPSWDPTSPFWWCALSYDFYCVSLAISFLVRVRTGSPSRSLIVGCLWSRCHIMVWKWRGLCPWTQFYRLSAPPLHTWRMEHRKPHCSWTFRCVVQEGLIIQEVPVISQWPMWHPLSIVYVSVSRLLDFPYDFRRRNISLHC